MAYLSTLTAKIREFCRSNKYQAWVGIAGLIDGGLGALKKVGEERQTEHFAGVDDQFQQDADSGGRSLDFSGGCSRIFA